MLNFNLISAEKYCSKIMEHWCYRCNINHTVYNEIASENVYPEHMPTLKAEKIPDISLYLGVSQAAGLVKILVLYNLNQTIFHKCYFNSLIAG